MIKRVVIRGFQSLRDISLDLGKVTIIVGHSDSGKTAVVRALKHASFNLSGTDFLTKIDDKTASKCQVAVETDDGILIWERTQKTVSYRLIAGGNDVTFTKMGRGQVPLEVVEFLKIREIGVDDTTSARIQFMDQHDAPFLVIDRGGVAAARVLGTLTGSNVFSIASKLAASERRLVEHRLELETERVKDLEIKVSQYDGLETKHRHYVALKSNMGLIEEKLIRLNRLQDLKQRWKAADIVYQRLVEETSNQSIDVDGIIVPVLRNAWVKTNRLQRLTELRKNKIGVESSLSSSFIPSLYTGDVTVLYKKIGVLRIALELRKTINARIASKDVLDQEETYLSKFVADHPMCPFEPSFKEHSGKIFMCRHMMGKLHE